MALRTSYGRETVHNAIEKQREEFSGAVGKILCEWKKAKRDSMTKDAKTIMEDVLPTASKDAESALEQTIKRFFLKYSVRRSGRTVRMFEIFEKFSFSSILILSVRKPGQSDRLP